MNNPKKWYDEPQRNSIISAIYVCAAFMILCPFGFMDKRIALGLLIALFIGLCICGGVFVWCAFERDNE